MKRIQLFFYNFRLEHLWAVTILVCIFAFVNSHPIRPYDFWLHIANGREIVAESAIPTTDIFSYTRTGIAFASASAYWLMQIIMYSLYTAGGGELIIFCQSMAITAAYAILLYIGLKISRHWRAAALGILFSALFGYGNWNVRPQTIAYLLAAFILLGIYKYKIQNKKQWLIIFPFAMTIWVNSHPSFPIGLIIIGCWFIEQVFDAFKSGNLKNAGIPLLATLGAFGACFISPYGIDVSAYIYTLLRDSEISKYIVEWGAPNFETLYGAIFLSGLLLVTILMGFSIKKISVMEALLFLIFGYLGLKYMRGAVWFGIVTAPTLSKIISNIIPETRTAYNKTADMINRVFLTLLLLIVVLSFPFLKSYLPFSPEKSSVFSKETPISATQYILDNHLPANIFHSFGFGSYLMWAAHPQYPVFIDARFDSDLYPLSFWDEYLSISAAESDWEQKLIKYNINTLLLAPDEDLQLLEAVQNSLNWKMVYQDESALVFTRR